MAVVVSLALAKRMWMEVAYIMSVRSLGFKRPHGFPLTLLVLLPLTIKIKPKWLLAQGGGKTPKRALKWSLPIPDQLTVRINDGCYKALTLGMVCLAALCWQ